MNKHPSPTNRRKFKRLTFSTKLILYSDSVAWDCELIDISLKGILFSKPKGWSGENNDFFRLKISLNGSANISMSVQVAHVFDDTVGAQWNKIDVDSFSRLKRVLELNTLDKRKIAKEISFL